MKPNLVPQKAPKPGTAAEMFWRALKANPSLIPRSQRVLRDLEDHHQDFFKELLAKVVGPHAVDSLSYEASRSTLAYVFSTDIEAQQRLDGLILAHHPDFWWDVFKSGSLILKSEAARSRYS